jgi:23S rRNA (adenine2503-C2)-methyltransferase
MDSPMHAPTDIAIAPAGASLKRSLAGLGRTELAEALGEIGVPERERRMRVAQLWHWIYFRGTRDFAAMSSISKELRAKLADHFTLERPEVVVEQVSADGTRKWLIRLPADTPGERAHEIECVYIPESDRGTLCVSSQVGCTLNCTFCHTGTQRLVRNLTAAEIVNQVMIARDRLGEWPGDERPEGAIVPAGERAVSNIVFMGMGEPLYNFDGVKNAIETIVDGEGLSIGKRRITVSTSGVVPEIERLGNEMGTMLAISLHATNDALRDELVPLNKKYPIKESARRLPRLSRRVERAPHHLRICDAQGRERHARRSARAREIAQGHSGQDQSHSVQSLAGHEI